MRNTSGLTRAQRKDKRASRKASWKKELLNYYIVGETNTSKAGVVYQRLKISTAVNPKRVTQEHPVGTTLFNSIKKLFGLPNES